MQIKRYWVVVDPHYLPNLLVLLFHSFLLLVLHLTVFAPLFGLFFLYLLFSHFSTLVFTLFEASYELDALAPIPHQLSALFLSLYFRHYLTH